MISSAQNIKIKLVRSLSGRSKEQQAAGAFLAEGVRLVEEAASANWPFRFVLFSDNVSERGMALIHQLEQKGIETAQVETRLMQSLSGTETSQGILAVLNEHPLPLPKKLDFILIPDSIRDPGNLGTLLRSAAAAGVQAVLLPPETAHAFSPKIVRAGMGAHFRLPIRSMTWEQIRSTVQGLHVYLADMNGSSCWELDLSQPLALIIGGEAQGASPSAHNLANASVSIPMAGQMESLNAGVAGSVLMFEVMRQRA